MRILTVIGTRPEAIKMLPLVKELQKYNEFEPLVCFSKQHDTLAENVFDFFKIKPDYTFNAKNDFLNLKEMTINFLDFFDVIFKETSPDLILTHGDTTTAFCASLSAFYSGIKVAHIEAGLRTHNPFSPFPEEFNRVAIDSVSTYHFAPTKVAAKNLLTEGRKSVFTVGNTGIDTLKYTIDKAYKSPILDEAKNKKIILITSHRRENLGSRLTSALLGIKDALQHQNDVFAIFPAHPNPKVKNTVKNIFSDVKNIKISPPLPLYDFHNILSRAHLIISDSGGIQEEASYLGIPLFLLRDTTERPECIECGNTKLIGTSKEQVAQELSFALNNEECIKSMQKRSFAFGDGNACEKIAKKLLSLC